MPLVYRAVWEDESHNPELVLDDEFRSWCRSKGLEDIDIPHRGTLTTGTVTVDVRRGDTESGRVLRTLLTETDSAAGRTWTSRWSWQTSMPTKVRVMKRVPQGGKEADAKPTTFLFWLVNAACVLVTMRTKESRTGGGPILPAGLPKSMR